MAISVKDLEEAVSIRRQIDELEGRLAEILSPRRFENSSYQKKRRAHISGTQQARGGDEGLGSKQRRG